MSKSIDNLVEKALKLTMEIFEKKHLITDDPSLEEPSFGAYIVIGDNMFCTEVKGRYINTHGSNAIADHEHINKEFQYGDGEGNTLEEGLESLISSLREELEEDDD